MTTDARLWHHWLRIQRLRRDIVGGSAYEPTPWRAVQRAAWDVVDTIDPRGPKTK